MRSSSDLYTLETSGVSTLQVVRYLVRTDVEPNHDCPALSAGPGRNTLSQWKSQNIILFFVYVIFLFQK